MTILWEGSCCAKLGGLDTLVDAQGSSIYIEQAPFAGSPGERWDRVVVDRDEAIDIAFAILLDCAPTLAAALEGLRGPAAAGADAITEKSSGQ